MNTPINRTWKSKQALNGHRIVRLDADTLINLTIVRDAYDEQSWAKSSVWSDTNGWLTLAASPISFWSIKNFSYVAKVGEWEDAMHSSLDALEREARELLDAEVK